MVINLIHFRRCGKLLTTFALMILYSICCLSGQDANYNYYYRVYFKDKGEVSVGEYSPYKLLSDKAIERRQKAGITVPDLRDIPVNADYTSQISSRGYKLHCKSKWMNSALFKTYDLKDAYSLLDLPFVKNVHLVKYPSPKNPMVISSI